MVGSYADRFSGFSQEDSQEFLTHLLQGLHEDLNSPTGVSKGEETREEEQGLSDSDEVFCTSNYSGTPLLRTPLGQLNVS